jgi:DNA-binding transcriptional LysR family regulator
MDRLEGMRVFVAVAEQQGFAAAARRLGLSAPAATRAVAALEARIGSRLLQRTTRALRLTEAGARYLADCKRILAEIEEAEASAAGSHRDPRGQLGVTAPVMFGRMHVAPLLLDFLDGHPQVTARLVLLDRVADLLEEGLDVALRIAHLPDSALQAVRVGSMRRVVCAAPGYLARHFTPTQPAELERLTAITFGAASAGGEWSFAGAQATNPRATLRVTPPSRLTVNAADVAIAAAVAGKGVTRVLSYQVAPELAAGRLVVLLEAYEPPPIPVHLVHLAGRRPDAKLRAFVDFAVARLRANPALNPG